MSKYLLVNGICVYVLLFKILGYCRAGIPQDFSRGFNNIKPQNTSLNTGITKSTIHPKLDPQFA